MLRRLLVHKWHRLQILYQTNSLKNRPSKTRSLAIPHLMLWCCPQYTGQRVCLFMFSCKGSLWIIFNFDPGVPNITSSVGASVQTSLLPLTPRGEIVSNVELVALDNSYIPPPSPLPTTTKDACHTKLILSTQSATMTGVDPIALALVWKDSDVSDVDTATVAAASPSLSHRRKSLVPTTCEKDLRLKTPLAEHEISFNMEGGPGLIPSFDCCGTLRTS